MHGYNWKKRVCNCLMISCMLFHGSVAWAFTSDDQSKSNVSNQQLRPVLVEQQKKAEGHTQLVPVVSDVSNNRLVPLPDKNAANQSSPKAIVNLPKRSENPVTNSTVKKTKPAQADLKPRAASQEQPGLNIQASKKVKVASQITTSKSKRKKSEVVPANGSESQSKKALVKKTKTRDFPPIETESEQSYQKSAVNTQHSNSKTVQNQFAKSADVRMKPIVQPAAADEQTSATETPHREQEAESKARVSVANESKTDSKVVQVAASSPNETKQAAPADSSDQLPKQKEIEMVIDQASSRPKQQKTVIGVARDLPAIENQPSVVQARKQKPIVQTGTVQVNGEQQYQVKNVSGTELLEQQQDERSPSDRGNPNIRYPNPRGNNNANPGLLRPGFRIGPDGRLIPDPTFPGDPRLRDPRFRQQFGVGPDGSIPEGPMPGQLDPFDHPYSDVPNEYAGKSLNGFGDCGLCCGASRYGIVEYLYFDRDGGIVTAANFNPGRHDYTNGWRITLGEKFDSFSGREMVYQGFDPWNVVSQRRNTGGQLTTLLVPSNGITLNSIGHLRNATFMESLHKTDLHSLEFNRVRWYWDVAKSFWGIRYINLEDRYRLSSANIFNQSGTYEIDTNNHMIGIHWGTNLQYDIGCKLSLSGWTKIGGYANFTDGSISLNNTGVQVLNNGDQDTEFTATFELGAVAHYQIGPRMRLRGGYEFMQFWDVMTASRNYTGTITGLSGTNMRSDDELFIHGASFGLEFFR